VRSYIPDTRILTLLAEVVGSFSSDIPRFNLGMRRSTLPPIFSTTVGKTGVGRRGLPLGNLTSQLLVNIYMNEFDQYVKHVLKATYYVRYADDFAFLSLSRRDLDALLPRIGDFLRERLKLELHPDKVFLKTYSSGVDFLGWVHFSDHRVLRTSTKRRMTKRTIGEPSEVVIASYLGLMKHGNAEGLAEPLRQKLKNLK
jgi:hypothetical protein